MAVLNLTKAFLNNLATGEAVSAQSGRDRAVAVQQDGEVRTYGGGRRRSVTQAGRRATIGVSLRYVTAADAATLEGWIGQDLLYRDDRGRRYAVVYFDIEYKEFLADKGRYDIGLTLHEITWVEGPEDSRLPVPR